MKLSDLTTGGAAPGKTLKLSDVQSGGQDDPGIIGRMFEYLRGPSALEQDAARNREIESAYTTQTGRKPSDDPVDYARHFLSEVSRSGPGPVAGGFQPGEGVAKAALPLARPGLPINPLSPEGIKAAEQAASARSTRAAAKAVEKNVRKAPEIVAGRVKQDIVGEGRTATEMLERLNKASAAGRPLSLLDVGGENVKALGGNLARQPGPARNYLRQTYQERTQSAGTRLDAQTRSALGSDSVYQTATALLKERSAAARPRYAEMEALQNIWSPRLQQFLDSPEVRKAMALGFKLERMDSLAEGREFNPTQMGVDLDAEGNVTILKVPNMRVLDIGKQGLDAVIAEERDPLTGRLTKTGRSYEKVREAYVNELDSLDTSGKYKVAREAWAGPSKSLDALRLGRTLIKRSPEEITEVFNKLSEGDKQFLRLGIADQLRIDIAEKGVTAPMVRAMARDSKNTLLRQKLRPLFKSEKEFTDYIDAVTDERAIFETEGKISKGAQTAEREAEDATSELGVRGLRGMINVARGHPLDALLNVLHMNAPGQMGALGVRQNPGLNLQVSKILADPKAGMAALRTLSEGDSAALNALRKQ